MSKKLILTVSALAVLILAQATNSLCASKAPVQSGRNRPITAGTNVASVDVFYSYLAPYGKWFTLQKYGLVWSPAVVGPDWSPYANGSWVYTDWGWTWESDDPWGWATCHYGRWILDATYGWVWVPGTIWAPAWVDWLRGRGYIGWAPLPPESAPETTEVDIPVSCYTFVEEPYFDTDDTPEHREPKHREHKHAGQYVHLPPSVGADLKKWGPGIPVWANPSSSPHTSTNSAQRPQKNKPVEGVSGQTTGQYSPAHPTAGKNGTTAMPTTPSTHSGLERPNRPAPNETNSVDVGGNSGAKAGQRQPAETYRRQADDAGRQQAEETRRQQEVQQRQAEEAGRRQAEEANRQQEAQRQQAEEARRQQEAQHRQAEEAQRRQAEESNRQQEGQRQQAEDARRQQEAQRQQAEEARRQQEAQQKQAEDARRQQDAQQKQAEDARRQQEAQQKQAEEAQRTKKP